MNNRYRIRLAIVGCGAIAKSYYLPILARKKNIKLVSIVDTNETIGKQLKEKYRARLYTKDYQDILHLIDAAIVCLPNFLHSQVAVDFLLHGVSVLCEKPMATNSHDALNMIEAATEKKTLLSIANVRRFYWSSREVKRIVSQRILGTLVSIEAEEGEIFSWPTASGFFFDRIKSGGGVMMDIGAHLLDLILWWVGDYPDSISYADDNFGGVEADVELEMTFKSTIRASVMLSSIRNLKKFCKLNFSDGEIIITPQDYNRIWQQNSTGHRKVLEGPRGNSSKRYFEVMIDDFLSSLIHNRNPFIDPSEVLPSIKLIEECYLKRKQIEAPWI